MLADDLTGTLEVGAILKQAGLRVQISIGGVPAVVGDQALVIDCQTRRLPAEAALARYTEILATGGRRAEELYLKVDSTLRGNVAAALQATLAHFPGRSVVFCPAYPSQGRTVENGLVLVNGEPLRARSTADESAEPVGNGVISELLVSLGNRVICYDARTEEDLRAIWAAVDAAQALVVVAGSAGLLAARYTRRAGAGLAGGRLAGRKWIIACGSMNPAAQDQLEDSPWTVLRHPATRAEVADRLAADGGVVLATPATRSEEDVTSWLAATVQGVGATGLVVIGGETAASILAACGIRSLEPGGEVLPGVPCSWVNLRGATTPLITKAGGFGAPGLLRSLINEINKACESR